jgi:sec-independent protein translocase protein TatA
MGFGSIWHWVIVLVVVLVLFGRGRISEIMGDFGKGISSFKKGMSEAEKPVEAPKIEGPANTPAETTASDKTAQS